MSEQSGKRKKTEEAQAGSSKDVEAYIEQYRVDWRPTITASERLMGELFFAMKFLKEKEQSLGHILMEYSDTLEEFDDVSPEDLNDAFERAISNYLILQQPNGSG